MGREGWVGGAGPQRTGLGFLHRKHQKVFSIAPSPTTSWLISHAKHRTGRQRGP